MAVCVLGGLEDTIITTLTKAGERIALFGSVLKYGRSLGFTLTLTLTLTLP